MNKPKITIEGVWKDGFHFRKDMHSAPSTDVVQMLLMGGSKRPDEPSLVRVFYNDALCREFNNETQKYNLCLEFPNILDE